jgi:hypothetical protein
VFEDPAIKAQEMWFGIEQEYTLFHDDKVGLAYLHTYSAFVFFLFSSILFIALPHHLGIGNPPWLA